MQGLISFWGKDIIKVKTKLASVKITIQKISMNPLMKKSIIDDIDTIFLFLRKGKNHEQRGT